MARVFSFAFTVLLISSCASEPVSPLIQAPAGTEIAVAIIEPSGTTYWGAVRVQREGPWRCVENKHAVFETGSLTKLFTSHLSSQLISSETISRYSSIGEVLSANDTEFASDIANVTLRQLITHTSGLAFLPDDLGDMPVLNSNPFEQYSTERLISYLRRANLSVEPGTYQYSNTGYAVVGAMLEAAAHSDYSELLDKLIADTLGLTQTTADRSRVADYLVSGQNKDGSTALYWDFAAFEASGGVYSSARDIARFLRYKFNHSNLAWQTRTQGRRQWLEQTGATGGFTSAAVMNPESGRAVVVLSNLSSLHEQAIEIPQLAETLLFESSSSYLKILPVAEACLSH